MKYPDDNSGLTRREFLQLAGGVVVFFSLKSTAEIATAAASSEPNSWLAIGEDGRIIVFASVVEVGQGIRTSLTQMVAEELSLSPDKVQMILGDTDRVPAEVKLSAGALATIGVSLRQAAADAREILLQLAAEKWGIKAEQLTLRSGRVLLPTDPSKSLGFGELAKGRRLLRRSKEPSPIKSPAEWEVIGKTVPNIDGRAYVSGEARFVADLRLPQMVYAKLLRPPCLDARLTRCDTRSAVGQPGVIAVVEEEDFVAVVATEPERAERAVRSIQATWEEGEHALMSTLYQTLRNTAKMEEKLASRGEVETALATARHGFSASYRTAFVAHAPIEPQAALAVSEGDRIIVYASTQRPFAHQRAVAEALALKPDRVRVIAPLVGGAFGGKDAPDISVAAARLARVVGRPVMVTQSREENLSWNYYRPAALIEIRCGVGTDGRLAAWDCDIFNCGSQGSALPYTIPNLRLRSYRCFSPLPQGNWRGNGGVANTFAREVHLDHLAGELGEDPIAYRLRHLENEPRLARVIRTAAERYGWQERVAPTGLGVGFACASDGGSVVAEIAEVEVERTSGQVRVRRVIIVYEGGCIVNPGGLQNQIEGAIVMGLGPTLREAVRCEQGRILTKSFASYPIPTIFDTPGFDLTLIPNPDLPPQAGGNAALFAIAPAVANAVFDATGSRVRELPISRIRSN